MRIGVVGALGYQGRKHVEELLKLDVDVVGCDTKDGGDYRELYELDAIRRANLEDVDGIVIATPNGTHTSIANYFLDRNIPVLVEKPLTRWYAEAKEMLDSAKEERIVLATGSVFSFNNSVKVVGEIIKDGLLGKLEFVKCSWCSQMLPWAEKDILLDLGPHLYDVLCSWNLEPQGYNSNTLLGGNHKLIFTGAELMQIEMRLSWVEGPKERSVKIIGEKYILVVDVLNQDVFVYERDELVAYKTHTKGLSKKGFDLQFSRNNTLQDELKDFLRQIEEGADYKLAEQGVRFLKWKESKGGEL